MNIEDIKEFTDVVAYSSISEAARRNHLSQQTLSRRIINLEKELGQRIFDRSTTLTLTPVGKVFLRYAHEILSITQEMQAEVDAIASSTQSVITVKRYPTDSFFRVLAGAIESMQEFCPNVKFEFTSKNQDDRELVIEGLIDIGFSREIVFEGASPCIEDDEIACMPLVSNSFPLIFGVPENHPILHIANPTLSDIASFKIAIPSFANKGALPNAVRDLFQKKQLPLRIDMVYSQSMLEYYAAVSRDSICLFNEIYSVDSITSQRRQYEAVRPSDGPYTVTASAVYAKSNTNPALPLVLEKLVYADAALAEDGKR